MLLDSLLAGLFLQLDFAGGLNERGIGVVSLTDAIATATVSGRFFPNVMASLAQVERELMVERTQAGLQGQSANKAGSAAANAS